MSRASFGRVLWLVSLVTVPVPMWYIGDGHLPALALLQISAYMAAVTVVEGGPGAWLSCWVIGLQGLVWAALLYLGARLAAATVTRVAGARTSLAVLGIAVVALVGLSMLDVYQAAIVGRGEPVNLLRVY